MKINTNSWHYKMLTKSLFLIEHWHPSNSLCAYFWQVILKLLFGFSFALAAASPIVLIILELSNWTTAPLLINIIGAIGLIVGSVYVLVVVMFFTLLLEQSVKIIKKWYKNKYPSKYAVHSSKETKPNILFSYLKAKKEKVCPIIQFEEK